MVVCGIGDFNSGAAGVKYAACVYCCGMYPGGGCAVLLPISSMDRRPSNSLTFDLAKLARSAYFTVVSVSDSPSLSASSE